MGNNSDNMTEYVDKYYAADPERDQFLFDGSEIQVGMWILAGDPALRADPDVLRNHLERGDEPEIPESALPPGMPPGIATMFFGGGFNEREFRDTLDENNRWCEVVRVEIEEAKDHGDHGHSAAVTFLGRYSDGTMRKRQYSLSAPWLARKASMQQPVEGAFEVPDTIEGIEGFEGFGG